MSAIGGTYNFDGAPVDERLLAVMRQTLSNRGPDGGGEFRSGSMGTVYRAFHTNRESCLESQPFVSCKGHVLCWDGRLDNREELKTMLRLDVYKDQTDVAIVMASYLKFGIDFPSLIVGDFALSIWDPNSKALLLSRDPIGARMLYYHSTKDRIIWSTELGLLLDFAGIPLQANDEYIADSLTRLPEPGQTPYKNINAVPPAHTVIAKDGGVRIRRFWRVQANREIRYKTDADYEEHFQQIFRDAVRCRLRTEGPVWAELSGGLDSSAIVCMANDIIKTGAARASSLQTVSRVFDEASKSDEREYIRAVEDRIGQKGLHLREDDYRIFTPLGEKYSRTIPNPIADFAEYYKALDEAMQKRGARVLLSGNGGDEVLGEARDPSPELVDLLTGCKLWPLHRCLLVWSGALNKPYSHLLWHKAILPVLPRRFRTVRSPSPEIQFFYKLYNQEFIKRMNLGDRLLDPNDFSSSRHFGICKQSTRFLRSVRLLSAGYYREFTNAEITYPYTHRPLIEFLAAIPFEQKIRPWETRSIMRRALSHLLPQEVAQRKNKGLIVYAYLRAATRESQRLHRLFADARVCAYGYVNRKELLEVLEMAKQGRDVKCLYLVYIIALEYWLRALERRKSIAQR